MTGGASGLGRSHALALAGEGADVTVFDLGDSHRDAEPGYALSRQAELDATIADVRANGRRALGLTGDVRNQEQLDAAVAATLSELGRIDILVANAGIALMAPAWEMPREEWDLQLGTNLTGVWQSCKAVIPHMIERQYGRIILISSTLALKGSKGFAGYAAAKAGVAGLGRALAVELAEHRITVNSASARAPFPPAAAAVSPTATDWTSTACSRTCSTSRQSRSCSSRSTSPTPFSSSPRTKRAI